MRCLLIVIIIFLSTFASKAQGPTLPNHPRTPDPNAVQITYFYVYGMDNAGNQQLLIDYLMHFGGKIVNVAVSSFNLVVSISHFGNIRAEDLEELLRMHGYKAHRFPNPPDMTKRFEFNSQGKYKEY